MKLKIFAAVVLILLIVGALAGAKVQQIQTLIASSKKFAPPPTSVTLVTVNQEEWQETLPAIGTITAVQGVNITAELPGMVREIAFESGSVVAKGDLLVRLDISSEEAQLRAIEAQVELARLTLNRVRTLSKDNTISQSELDTAEASLKQHEASADTIRATLEKKTIRAPFAGRLGIRQINLGQYLETGKTIVSLQSPAPVYADFTLPQQELQRLKVGMKVQLTNDAYAGRKFEGKLTAINPDLDQSTRSVKVQATLENADQALRPGMFARVEVLLPEKQTVLVVPVTSVLSSPYGNSVYVIEPTPPKDGEPAGLAVRQQFVRTGKARGDFISVASGLKGGEKIVRAALFKLRNGMAVVENNGVVPKSEAAPRLSDS